MPLEFITNQNQYALSESLLTKLNAKELVNLYMSNKSIQANISDHIAKRTVHLSLNTEEELNNFLDKYKGNSDKIIQLDLRKAPGLIDGYADKISKIEGITHINLSGNCGIGNYSIRPFKNISTLLEIDLTRCPYINMSNLAEPLKSKALVSESLQNVNTERKKPHSRNQF